VPWSLPNPGRKRTGSLEPYGSRRDGHLPLTSLGPYAYSMPWTGRRTTLQLPYIGLKTYDPVLTSHQAAWEAFDAGPAH
jgi:hypothetical protein